LYASLINPKWDARIVRLLRDRRRVSSTGHANLASSHRGCGSPQWSVYCRWGRLQIRLHQRWSWVICRGVIVKAHVLPTLPSMGGGGSPARVVWRVRVTNLVPVAAHSGCIRHNVGQARSAVRGRLSKRCNRVTDHVVAAEPKLGGQEICLRTTSAAPQLIHAGF